MPAAVGLPSVRTAERVLARSSHDARYVSRPMAGWPSDRPRAACGVRPHMRTTLPLHDVLHVCAEWRLGRRPGIDKPGTHAEKPSVHM